MDGKETARAERDKLIGATQRAIKARYTRMDELLTNDREYQRLVIEERAAREQSERACHNFMALYAKKQELRAKGHAYDYKKGTV